MPPAALAVGGLALGTFGASKDRRAAKDATKANERSTAASQAFIEKSTAQARGDVLKLAPLAEANRLAGFGGALDVFKQAIPQQLQSFQQGNITAQDIQQQGQQQQQAAILGTGLPSFQAPVAQQLPDFSNIQLPQFQTSQQAFAPVPLTDQEIARKTQQGQNIANRFNTSALRGF